MKFIKIIFNRIYAPLLLRYLSRDRTYSYKGVKLVVKAGVFHSGFFPGTKFMLGEILQFDLKNKSLIEVGCGSGLLSITAAKNGARVVASDISPDAIACTSENARLNGVFVNAVVSDLFSQIPKQRFDYIVISPPYFRGTPKNKIEQGWYYGEGFEFFEKLFNQIKLFLAEGSRAFMALSEACEIEQIRQCAQKENLDLTIRETKKFFPGEIYFFFEITRS